MPEETLDIIDAEDTVIGQATKTEVHEKNLLHRAAAILVETADGAYLIPTSAAHKAAAGQLLHSSAGHVQAGETYLEAAVRELREETGFVAPARSFRLLGSYILNADYGFRAENIRFEIFTVKYNVKLGPLVFKSEQVDERWLDIEELREIYSNEPGRLSPTLKMTLEKLFGFKNPSPK